MFDAKLFNEICSHYDVAFSKDHSSVMLLDEQGNAKKIEEEDLRKIFPFLFLHEDKKYDLERKEQE